MTNGLQLTLQQLMADWLANDPYFVDVPIITEFSKDIASDINQALGYLTAGGTAKAGICIVIVTPTADTLSVDTAGPYFDKIRMVARVICAQNFAKGGQRIHAADQRGSTSLVHAATWPRPTCQRASSGAPFGAARSSSAPGRGRVTA